MNNILGNFLSTPSKSKTSSTNNDSSKSISDCSISEIYGQNSPSNEHRNCIMINVSSDDTNAFNSTGTCVTSTPVGRGSTLQFRKSSICKTKRYSLKSENEIKRVDITDQVNALENSRDNIEKIFNDIYMIHLRIKYSRLNTINYDMEANESYIYLYPTLFNSNVMFSKFVSKIKTSSVYIVNHRYDTDNYILKTVDQSNNKFISSLNLRILHEIRILKLIGGHPHVVDYCDSWLEEEKFNLQLRYVSGGSLQNYIDFRKQTLENDEGIFMSTTAATILLAHMSSVLAYFHDILNICHGNINTHHILVDSLLYSNNKIHINSEQSRCYQALISDEKNFDLTFKLCDFTACEAKTDVALLNIETAPYDEYSCDTDILFLGITIFNCFCGQNHEATYDFQGGDQNILSEKLSEEWIYIIKNMCHKDTRERWTPRIILLLDGIDQFILPEARYYIPDYSNNTPNGRHTLTEIPIQFLKPFEFEKGSDISLYSPDNYWIKSEHSNEMVDITEHMKSITKNRRDKDQILGQIHDTCMKFKEFSFCSQIDNSNLHEKCIFDYPVLFNSEVTTSKFSSQIIISETKLSKIYIVDHRFDGDSYILKVGLESMTFIMSDSSREIVNEMKILKLIGKHPNIVGYCDCWIEQEKFHLQLKFVTGGSLYDFTQGNFSQLKALSDTKKKIHKYYISSQCAFILLAHIISVLVYLHDELRIFHGDIKPSNILVELVGQKLDPESRKNAKLYCHNTLVSEELNLNLRFKLCDFGRSGPTANIMSMEEGDGRYLPNLSERFADSDFHIRATSRDIFSLGLSIYDCFGGVIDQDSARDIRVGQWRKWPDRVSNEWRHIIMNLSHIDPGVRWSAPHVMTLDAIQPYILPEAKYYMRGYDAYKTSSSNDGSFSDMAARNSYNGQNVSPVNVSETLFEDMDCSF